MRIFIGIISLLSVVFFENCGSTAGTGFNLSGTSLATGLASTNAGSTVPLQANSISLPLTTITSGAAISPTSVISGSNLNGVTCTFSIVDSANTQVVAPVIGTYSGTTGSLCSTSMTVPTTAGTYGVLISVMNSGGERSTNLLAITVVGTTPASPAPVTPPTPVTPPVPPAPPAPVTTPPPTPPFHEPPLRCPGCERK